MSKQKSTPSVRSVTEREYDTTLKYLSQWDGKSTFANFLLTQNMAQATRIKHLRQEQARKRKVS